MRKFTIALIAGVIAISSLVISAGSASAGTTKAPTMHASNVAKGKTIRPTISTHDSKIVAKSSTLWQGKTRIRDWSPKPGVYKVKTVIRYKTKTVTRKNVWVPDEYCYGDGYTSEDYVYNEETGEYEWQTVDVPETCEDNGYWDTVYSTKWSGTKRIARYDTVRVASDETPGCVSRSEFRDVKDGMSKATVHGIFGTSGWLTSSGSGGEWREYTTCDASEWSSVQINFDPRVSWKYQYISYD